MPMVNRNIDWKKILKDGFLGIPESERNKTISDQINELTELVNRKHIRTEVLMSMALEKESMSQDKFDELMNMLKEIGRQKGFNVE